jgi:hypothetical protein
MVHVKEAGVGSVFPAVSTALTLYAWVPKARLLQVTSYWEFVQYAINF